jgi:hypothetical protein
MKRPLKRNWMFRAMLYSGHGTFMDDKLADGANHEVDTLCKNFMGIDGPRTGLLDA